ncbi:collectrin isoform X4 [Ictidomys tridecemlineatus]
MEPTYPHMLLTLVNFKRCILVIPATLEAETEGSQVQEFGMELKTYPTQDAENAFKVRLSIRRALGDKAYVWDTNEEYLFRAMVAFSMRKVPNRETTEISHVLLCNVTQRVSFWFVVTDPSKNHTLPAVEVQSAIRKNKGSSEVDDAEEKCENTITIENGIPCDPLDLKGGHINDVFVTEDERLTPL